MSIAAQEAQKLIAAGVKRAQADGLRVTITVVDAGGEVVAVHRMDGSGAANFDLSYGLAYTAALFRTKGENVARFADRGWFRALSVMRGGRVMAAKGALPVVRDGEVIAAVGVSGAPEEKDFEVAEAAIAALS